MRDSGGREISSIARRARVLAQNLAAKVEGVKTVENKLTVKP
jgi:hypothetical protein